MGHHHADVPTVFQVQISTPSVEQTRYVLNGCVLASRPNVVEIPALPFQFVAQGAGRVAVDQPRRIADYHIHFALGDGYRAHQIASVVGPDVIAALGV